jgi:hypothetical protein
MLAPDGDGCDGDGPTFEGCMQTMFRTVAVEEMRLARKSIAEGIASVVENGQVLEPILDKMGWSLDKNAEGEDLPRTQTFAQAECRQRTKLLSHPKQQSMRAVGLERLHNAIIVKFLAKRGDVEKALATNTEAEEELAKQLTLTIVPAPTTRLSKQVTSTVSAWHAATCFHFSKLKLPQLRAFIAARSGPVLKPSSFFKGKGKVKYSATDGPHTVATAVTQAFDVRQADVNLRVPPAPQPRRAKVTIDTVALQPTVEVPRAARRAHSASVLVGDPAFAALVGRCFVGNTNSGHNTDTKHMAELAAHAERICRGRFSQHIAERAPGTESHYVWRWTLLNLPRVVAVAVLFGHVSPRAATMTAGDTILCGPGTGRFPEFDDTNKGAMGVYCVSDQQHYSESGWCRVGMTAQARGFEGRREGHDEGAKHGSSRFYQSYPAVGTTLTAAFRASYTTIKFFVGVGWRRSDVSTIAAICDRGESGVLVWPDDDMVKIRKLQVVGGTDEDRQVRMAAYLIELVYDLMVSPRDCVSDSAGFEQCLGLHYSE